MLHIRMNQIIIHKIIIGLIKEWLRYYYNFSQLNYKIITAYKNNFCFCVSAHVSKPRHFAGRIILSHWPVSFGSLRSAVYFDSVFRKFIFFCK